MEESNEYLTITTRDQLAGFCDRAANSQYIAFDTEFVSENRYRPQLCLIQIATESELAIIDAIALTNLDLFWELLVAGNHLTLVHASREEFLFCFRAVGRRPRRMFDVQYAAGMIGLEYPAAYGNLVSKLLNISLEKGETRTDWAKRPLTAAQIRYALQDVIYLKPIYDKINARLTALGRQQWLIEETNGRFDDLEQNELNPQWGRLPGISGLSNQALGIVREIYNLRDEIAKEKNKSPRRILPDDLLIELARRGISDPKKLKAIRGFENRVSRSMIDDLGKAIDRALALPPSQRPTKPKGGKTINLGLLGQYLVTALKIICDQEQISAGIVGTTQDLRELAAWHLGMSPRSPKPLLATGWRAQIIGKTIEEMIDGKIAIRVKKAKSADPLEIFPVNPQSE